MNERVVVNTLEMIGRFVQERREEMHITPTALGERVGLDPDEVIDFERGICIISLDVFIRIAFELKLFFFLEEKDGEGKWSELMRNRWKRPGDNN